MASKKIEHHAWILKIADVEGWILVGKDDDSDEWNIAWLEPFRTKKSALGFAVENHWSKPYRAIRGRITVL